MDNYSKTNAPIIRLLGLDYLPSPLVDNKVKGIVYYGYAPLGTEESELGWLIIRKVTANDVTRIEYATPEPDKFVHSWTNRNACYTSSLVREGYLHNGEFYADANFTTLLPHDGSSVYIDLLTNTGYMWNGTLYVVSKDEEGAGGGSGDVKAADLYTAGTQVIKPEHLPSYVDDVLEGYLNNGTFYEHRTGSGTAQDPYVYSDPYTPESGKIYVDKGTTPNSSYRWSGTEYTLIGGGVNEVYVNGVSVVSNGVASINTHVGSTTLDTPLQIDKQYVLNGISSLSLVLPSVGSFNSIIQVVFTPASTFTPTVTGSYVGEQVEAVIANYTYEYLFAWDGIQWVLLTLYY